MSGGLVTGAEEACVRLTPEPAAVRKARGFVARTCEQWELVCTAAELVCSELVTNAVRHATADIAVIVRHLDHRLFLGVVDDCADRPQLMMSGDLDEHGRGLAIVAALTARWGVTDLGPDGKIVWAQIQIDSSRADKPSTWAGQPTRRLAG